MPFASPLEREVARRLGEVLRRRRKEIGLSQVQLALDVGLDDGTISNYEIGIARTGSDKPSNPGLATLAAMAERLGTTVPEIIDEAYGLPPRGR